MRTFESRDILGSSGEFLWSHRAFDERFCGVAYGPSGDFGHGDTHSYLGQLSFLLSPRLLKRSS